MELKEIITHDCEQWTRRNNNHSMIYHYLRLQNDVSEESHMYSIMLDGKELWYGTLEECNAVVKAMLREQEVCHVS